MLPLAHPPSLKVVVLAAELVGTIGDAELHDQIDELTIEENNELDAIVFNCEQCNWWCSTDELNEGPAGQQWCDQCLAENEE
jgi:hypothetical protein